MTVTPLENSDVGYFLQLIYGDNSGYAYAPTLDSNNKWEQHFFKWPDERSQLINHITTLAGTHDVYYSPSLFSTQSSQKAEFHKTNVVWAEFDGKLPEPGSFDEIPHPTIRVRSSYDDHEHWYWHLEMPIQDADTVERLNKSLAYRLHADTSGWDAVQVLRPIGTINHKNEKDLPVRLLSDNQHKTYAVEDFDVVPTPPKYVKDSINLEAIPDPISVIARYLFTEKEIEFFRKKEIPVGQRSSALTALAYVCAEKRMMDEDFFALLLNADERWGKFRKRPDRNRRLLDLINYSRQKYPLEVADIPTSDDPYPMYGFRSFVETDIQIEWLIPGLLQKGGLFFLSGPPGVGKTSMSLEFLVNMALGREYLGWQFTRPMKIIMLSLEMGHADLKWFITNMFPNITEEELDILEMNLKIIPVGYDIMLDTEREQTWLASLIDREEPDGVVIDSLGTTTSEAITEERVVKAILSPLAKMRAIRGMFVWFIHHNRKAQTENKQPKKLADVFGSQYIIAQATTVIGLWPVGSDIEINSLKIRLWKPFDSFIAERDTERLGFKKQDNKKLNQALRKGVEDAGSTEFKPHGNLESGTIS